jgi:hypothetical protein
LEKRSSSELSTTFLDYIQGQKLKTFFKKTPSQPVYPTAQDEKIDVENLDSHRSHDGQCAEVDDTLSHLPSKRPSSHQLHFFKPLPETLTLDSSYQN